MKKLSSSQQSLNGVKRRRTQKVVTIGLDLGAGIAVTVLWTAKVK